MQRSIMQQSERRLMRTRRNSLKMYLKCICGEKSVKSRKENAGTKKESSSAKWKKLTQKEKMATTIFQSL